MYKHENNIVNGITEHCTIWHYTIKDNTKKITTYFEKYKATVTKLNFSANYITVLWQKK